MLNVYIKDIFLYIDDKNNRPYWLMPVLLFPDQLESVFLTADKFKIKTFQIFKWTNIGTDIGLKILYWSNSSTYREIIPVSVEL